MEPSKIMHIRHNGSTAPRAVVPRDYRSDGAENRSNNGVVDLIRPETQTMHNLINKTRWNTL